MKTFDNPFKRALAEGRRQAGLWMTTGRPASPSLPPGPASPGC